MARTLKTVGNGVYNTRWGPRDVRVIVLSEVSRESRNALWQLFSAVPEGVQYGASNYSWRTPDLSTLPQRLYDHYRLEGFQMPFTIEDYREIVKREAVTMIPPEELLAMIPAEKRVRSLTPEERLQVLLLDERFRGVSLDELKALLDERRRRAEGD